MFSCFRIILKKCLIDLLSMFIFRMHLGLVQNGRIRQRFNHVNTWRSQTLRKLIYAHNSRAVRHSEITYVYYENILSTFYFQYISSSDSNFSFISLTGQVFVLWRHSSVPTKMEFEGCSAHVETIIWYLGT